MEAVRRQLVGCDVVTEDAGPSALGQQVPDHAVELLLRSDDPLVPVQKHREFGAVVPAGPA
ncbi:hypothetical protein [Streptomyces sp. NPDC050704]|uniref:hypothetical protein n=1 Tax=Streptomyces sp. NPDC050704 TaxID=3157219 RepID=UPI003437FBB0